MFNRSLTGLAGATIFLTDFVFPVYGEEHGKVPLEDGLGDVGAPCDGCDSLASPSCAVGCRDWRIMAGANFLKRTRPDSLIWMQETSDPTRNLNADAFDFGLHAGWELSVVRSCRRRKGVRHFSSLAASPGVPLNLVRNVRKTELKRSNQLRSATKGIRSDQRGL